MLAYDCLFKEITNGLIARLTKQLPHFARRGIRLILLPNLTQTAYGANSESMGYDAVSMLNVGQHKNDPLRWGTAQEIQVFTTLAYSYGIDVIEDWGSIHQLGGQPPYPERGADGKIDPNLFPKPASLFGKPRDPVFNADGGAADGVRITYDSLPKNYMRDGQVQSTTFRQRVLGLNGWRGDEMKDEDPVISTYFARNTPGRWKVAEVSDGRESEQDRFVRATQGTMAVIDFPRHYAYRTITNGGSLRTLTWQGYNLMNPSRSWVYPESHDTDGPDGIVNNKLWPYFEMCTGVPCEVGLIYAKDYEVYGLSDWIDQYAYVGTRFALGAHAYVHVADDTIAWTRDGNGGQYGQTEGLLCGFSSDPINTQNIWLPTTFGPNKWIHNYLPGGAQYLKTNSDGWVNVPFAPNYYGNAQNGFAYSLADVDPDLPVIKRNPRPALSPAALFDFSSITVRLP